MVIIKFVMSFEKGRNYNFPMDKSLFEEELKDYILASRNEHVDQQTKFYNLFDDAFIKLNSEEKEYIIGLANGVLQNVLNSQEVASDFYRSDKEGWTEFTTNSGDRKSENPKALRIADRTTLKEVFTNAQDYQDMIGWSSFRFGRDAQKLPKFDMDRFYEKSGEKPTLVKSPLFVKLIFEKTKQFDFEFGAKQKGGGKVTLRMLIEDIVNKDKKPIISTKVSVSTTDPNSNEKYQARLTLSDSPNKFLSDLQDAKQEEIEEKGVFSGEWLEEPSTKLNEGVLPEAFVGEKGEEKKFKLSVDTENPYYKKTLEAITYENLFEDSNFLVSDERKEVFSFRISGTAVWNNFDNREFVDLLLEPNNDIDTVVNNKFTLDLGMPGKDDREEFEIQDSALDTIKNKINEIVGNMVIKPKYAYKTVATWTGLPFTRGSLRASEKFQLHLDRLKERLFDLEELGFDVKGGE